MTVGGVRNPATDTQCNDRGREDKRAKSAQIDPPLSDCSPSEQEDLGETAEFPVNGSGSLNDAP